MRQTWFQRKAAKLILGMLFTLIVLSPLAQAQTFTVLHTFTGGEDGSLPYGSVTLDRGGNLYGTASAGGFMGNTCASTGCGTVFKLTQSGSGWIFTILYSFHGNAYGNADGATPNAGVTVGPNGTLYGTTTFGGSGGLGTVFNLQPPAHIPDNILGGWSETVLYRFLDDVNGYYPFYGSLIFDPAGNIYGTAWTGGAECADSGGCGTVFELTPHGGGGWTISSFQFLGHGGGGNPLSGVVRDASGNLYGTTTYDNWNPVVYKLTFGGSESGLYSFTPEVNDFTGGSGGSYPFGGIALDATGNLYGTTMEGGGAAGCGQAGCGVVWKLTL